ncbi:MAG: hypothetical protein CMB73_05550 [Euryarchaeota archaeon]|nr:hypothetical protein [Euryarchaeota archaeon]
MCEFYQKWSVASVFNQWGICRYKEAYEIIYGSASYTTQSSFNVNEVAIRIRKLGYDVKLGLSIVTGNNYIVEIRKKNSEGDYIYCYGFWSRSGYERVLCGDRTIYQKVDVIERGSESWKTPLHENLQKVTNLFEIKFPKDNLYEIIDKGASCNISKDGYREGVSTIGNTLPNDIVEMLCEFKSNDPNFIKEPDYEFYIPECMVETRACPADYEFTTIEDDEDLQSTHCCPLTNNSNNSYSSSSDSDDE